MCFIKSLKIKESTVLEKGDNPHSVNSKEVSLKQHFNSIFNRMTQMVQVSLYYGIESILW